MPDRTVTLSNKLSLSKIIQKVNNIIRKCKIFVNLNKFAVRKSGEVTMAPLLAEALGVAAAAAELLRGGAMGKALADGPGPGRDQDLLQLLPEQIPQGDVALMIQAAGDHRAVAENADLVPQAVAGDAVESLRGGQVRPVKLNRLPPFP